MATPNITIVNVSRDIISNETWFNKCDVAFKADQDISYWNATATIETGNVALSTGVGTSSWGPIPVVPSDFLYCSDTLFPSFTKINANVEIHFVINSTDLVDGDGIYRIDITAISA